MEPRSWTHRAPGLAATALLALAGGVGFSPKLLRDSVRSGWFAGLGRTWLPWTALALGFAAMLVAAVPRETTPRPGRARPAGFAALGGLLIPLPLWGAVLVAPVSTPSTIALALLPFCLMAHLLTWLARPGANPRRLAALAWLGVPVVVLSFAVGLGWLMLASPADILDSELVTALVVVVWSTLVAWLWAEVLIRLTRAPQNQP